MFKGLLKGVLKGHLMVFKGLLKGLQGSSPGCSEVSPDGLQGSRVTVYTSATELTCSARLRQILATWPKGLSSSKSYFSTHISKAEYAKIHDL